MPKNLITRIPTTHKHEWIVTLDGRSIEPSEFVATHRALGTLSWGFRPEETVGWIWEEIGGGGVGTVPYTILNDQLMIGLIQQERYTMPDNVAWNIPRGFLDPGLTHFESAEKETLEELGVKPLADHIKTLPGAPANSNSTFFDTRTGNGFRYYSLHVPQALLDCSQKWPVFRPKLFIPKSGPAERIMACHFVQWREAARVADNFTNAGIARLIASDDTLLQYLS